VTCVGLHVFECAPSWPTLCVYRRKAVCSGLLHACWGHLAWNVWTNTSFCEIALTERTLCLGCECMRWEGLDYITILHNTLLHMQMKMCSFTAQKRRGQYRSRHWRTLSISRLTQCAAETHQVKTPSCSSWANGSVLVRCPFWQKCSNEWNGLTRVTLVACVGSAHV
jgi:hypothetical protein